MLLVNTILVV